MDDYRLMEVSGSAAAAKESIDNMGKEEEKESSAFQKNKRKRVGIWGSETESDDDDGSETNKEEEEEEEDEEDCGGRSEDDDPPPEDPILNLIKNDDSDGLMQFLKISKDGNHFDTDYDYYLLKHAFQSACCLNKSGCLQALLYCGVDWFAQSVDGGVSLLMDTCVADSKDTAQLLIDYAKEKNVLHKLLGAAGRMTPLHAAGLFGSWNVVKLLLDEGADPCMQNALHKLPCDIAYPGSKAQKLLGDAVMNKARRGFI